MKKYMVFDTGEIYTEAEIKQDYENYRDEMPYKEFEDYMETMLALGMQRAGGFVEVN